MEIGRKFLIPYLPEGHDAHPPHQIEQTCLYTGPAIRVCQEDNSFYLTYRDKGLPSREGYNLPLTRETYVHLFLKTGGVVLTKKCYLIPLDGSDHLTIELDAFEGHYAGLPLAEVELTSGEEAVALQAPEWFRRGVTPIREHQNSRLAYGKQGIRRKGRFIRS